MTREKLKMAEVTIIKRNESIESLSKAFEKQREKNDLQRVIMEWKLKKQENDKEVNQLRKISLFYSFQKASFQKGIYDETGGQVLFAAAQAQIVSELALLHSRPPQIQAREGVQKKGRRSLL